MSIKFTYRYSLRKLKPSLGINWVFNWVLNGSLGFLLKIKILFGAVSHIIPNIIRGNLLNELSGEMTD